jgi:hypothetical protein
MPASFMSHARQAERTSAASARGTPRVGG